MPWTLDDIIAATGGELIAGERGQRFDGLAIDSRTIAAAEAFVAIRGAVHDGHRFIDAALARGVRGLIVERLPAGGSPPAQGERGPVAWVRVADTTRALGELGA